MSLSLDHPDLAAVLPRLSPYLRRQLTLAGDNALRLHADEVSLEHLVWTLSLDDDSALFVTVDQAFADTDTVAADLLSLCGGILVSTRSGALPFSTRGVRAVRAARDLAREHGLAEVDAACLLTCAAEELDETLQRDLAEAGLDAAALRASLARGDQGLDLEGHLFKHFGTAARQAVVVAARQAAGAGEDSIGPARIVAAAVGAEEALAELSGLSARRAKVCIEGRAADPTPPPARELPPEGRLCQLLGGLPENASSLVLAARLLESPESELAQVFGRQKITPDLLSRAMSAYDDPAE